MEALRSTGRLLLLAKLDSDANGTGRETLIGRAGIFQVAGDNPMTGPSKGQSPSLIASHSQKLFAMGRESPLGSLLRDFSLPSADYLPRVRLFTKETD
jgi:hypothetical protein